MPNSFLWLSGWSVYKEVWDEQISFWPQAVHQKIDFSMCTRKEDHLPQVQQALLQLPTPVCIVGWSLGAFVALELWNKTTHPRHSFYLTGVGSQFVRSDLYPYAWDQRVLKRMKKQLDINPAEVLQQFDKKIFSHGGHDEKWHKLRETTPSIASLHAGLDYLIDFTFEPSLNCNTPTFLLGGEEDPITSSEGTIHLHQHLPHSTLTQWKDAGHIPFLTHPQQFHKWMRKIPTEV